MFPLKVIGIMAGNEDDYFIHYDFKEEFEDLRQEEMSSMKESLKTQ